MKSAFSQIWDEDELVVSMDAMLIWKPWWLNERWRPKTEGLHLDQNPFHKRDLCSVQGMVILFPVTEAVGGLEVVPRSHLEASKDAYRERYPKMKNGGDWCVLEKKDPLQGTGKLLLAEPGDLIIWDSRTVHGGVVGPGEAVEGA